MLGHELAPDDAEPPPGSALEHLVKLSAAVEAGQITEEDLQGSLQRRMEAELAAQEAADDVRSP